jgi:hypothetical protein
LTRPTGSTLARVDVSVYPGSQVAYVDCEIGDHVTAAGWTITGGAAPSTPRFWEYRSKNPRGNARDVSQRVAGRQMTADEAAMLRDPKTALGGWQPP